VSGGGAARAISVAAENELDDALDASGGDESFLILRPRKGIKKLFHYPEVISVRAGKELEETPFVRSPRKKNEYTPEKFTYIEPYNSPFSQQFECEFVIDGRLYNCAEQWMMQQKCMLFGQLEMAEKIMLMEDPKAMKRATERGKIPNYDQSIWDKYSCEIVHEGNTHKFAQNLVLYLALKSTVGTTLVETSPYDLVWGCGCREYESAAKQRKTWRGLNLLGEILTEVRDELVAERDRPHDGDVLAMGLSREPVADFGEWQREGTVPSDQKWRRRLKQDAQKRPLWDV